MANTLERYRNYADKTDKVANTYARMSLDKKNQETDVMKILENKKEEELIKKELNQAAELVVQRINDKLRGTEFPVRQQKQGVGQNQGEKDDHQLVHTNKKSIEDQVDLLIQ